MSESAINFADVLRILEESVSNELEKLGKFNLIVLGDSGAGKTTLINAVFGVQLGETGIGNAVTQEVRLCHRHQDDPLRIYDTPGFELGGGSVDEVVKTLSKLVKEKKGGPPAERIHAVWFVVNSRTARFLDGHASVIEALDGLGLPVFVVLTRVAKLGEEIEPEALQLAESIRARELHLAGQGQVFLVNSQPLAQFGGASPLPVHGLDELITHTIECIPAVAQAAAASTQRVKLALQRQRARKIVLWAQTLAAGAAAIPIPLADLAGVTSIQATMIARISATYGMPLKRETLAGVAGAILLGEFARKEGAAKAGEWLAGEAAKHAARQVAKQASRETVKQAGKQAGKLIPVVNVAIGVVSGAAAMSLTRGIGYAWIELCELIKRRPELASNNVIEMVTLFRRLYQKNPYPQD